MGVIKTIKNGFKSVPKEAWYFLAVTGAAIGAAAAMVTNKHAVASPVVSGLGKVMANIVETQTKFGPYTAIPVELSEVFDKFDWELLCKPIRMASTTTGDMIGEML